jgi:hypothetical protein
MPIVATLARRLPATANEVTVAASRLDIWRNELVLSGRTVAASNGGVRTPWRGLYRTRRGGAANGANVMATDGRYRYAGGSRVVSLAGVRVRDEM